MTRADTTYNQPRITCDTVIIANGGTVSTAINLDGVVPIGIITPATMTGTAITLQFSHDGTTYTALYDTSGSAVSITSAASRWIRLSKEDYIGARNIKLVSGSAEGSERTLIVVLMRI